ncbi:MAG: AEC family transporter [Desulfovibrio sp.]|uniref:AEC family transporter n=1 Tax=Desulfovibrio sp. TaxID=885 RepID=UPI0039E6EF4A
MEKFLLISFFVGTGVLFRRLPAFPKETAQALNMFALYVALPAVILLKVPQISFTPDMILPATLPWTMLLLSVAMVWCGSRLLHWEKPVTGVLLLIVPIGNTAFMGVPMIKTFFGDQGIPPLIIYDQLGTMPIFAIYGSAVLALYSSGAKIKIMKIVERAVLFPPTLALIAGLVFRSTPYPNFVMNSLEALSEMLIPLVMTAIGFQLKVRLSPRILHPLLYGLTVKLAAAPLIALLACRLLGLHDLTANVAIFEAGMPPMVTAGALAMAAGLAPELAAATVSLGMLLSFLSLPALYWIIDSTSF